MLHGKEHLCRFAIRAPLERPLAPPHGPFREILALHWKHKRDTILAQLRAYRDNVIKYHGAAAARAHAGTRYLGGDTDAPSSNVQSTVVDSMIDDVRYRFALCMLSSDSACSAVSSCCCTLFKSDFNQSIRHNCTE